MSREKVYNFSAGPSMMPEEVLLRAKAEIEDYSDCGMSVMEMSHRSKLFADIFASISSSMIIFSLIVSCVCTMMSFMITQCNFASSII